MATFSNSESGSSVRTKINAAITTVDGLGSGDNLLMTAAERTKLSGVEASADVTDTTNVAAAGAPIISQGAGAPVSTPSAVGDIYVDTTNDLVYMATDTVSSADWDQSTGLGGGTLNNIVEDTTPQLGGDLDAQGNNITSVGPIFMNEQAAADADVAGDGQIWVRNDTPNVLMFTDDAGTDAEILTNNSGSTLTSVAATVSDNIPLFDASDSDNAKQDTIGDILKLKPESFIIACSDETTDLTVGTAKATFRMPYAFTVTDVRASCTTAPTGATLTVDINESGVSILSTKLTIDASEKTSETAATAAVISDTSLADDAEITIDIDQIGSTEAGAGLKVTIIGTQT